MGPHLPFLSEYYLSRPTICTLHRVQARSLATTGCAARERLDRGPWPMNSRPREREARPGVTLRTTCTGSISWCTLVSFSAKISEQFCIFVMLKMEREEIPG
ncbi:hypothetical protein BRADI_1g17815v3 [Brachypodium distachyon]|uniref:Uncharacterized protein n=1 Tax=Brachypodium distachyon TaxID=15368 RepID=A0A2K2DJX3_BRADI|nr:hypothetical protein BRADI_1g17815v3 [Brachypodium distachyon]